MPGTYTFAIDQDRDLLTITFDGFFGLSDLASYEADKNKTMAQLRCAPNQHLTLCDFSACIPQSQAVLDLFQVSLDDPAWRSRRLAVVVNSALAGFQAQRIVTRPNAAFFQNFVDAERWLFGSEDQLRQRASAIR